MNTVESIIENLPPGHDVELRHLLSLRDDGRLPHALLLAGQRGIGKGLMAQAFASLLLNNSKSPDDHSRLTALIEAGTHPDLVHIKPEEGKTTISVDQVRQLSERLALTSHFGGIKIAIINPAEAMTIAASNALLKTLEEPPGDALLLLLTSNKGRLPQTVKSRCQQVTLQRPPLSQAKDWLSRQIESQNSESCLLMAQGAPLLAQEYHKEGLADAFDGFLNGLTSLLAGKTDPLSVAEDNKDIPFADLLSWVQSLVRAMIMQKMTGEGASNISTNMLNHLKLSADGIDLLQLFAYQDYLKQAEKEVDANLNRELFLEELLARWSTLAKS